MRWLRDAKFLAGRMGGFSLPLRKKSIELLRLPLMKYLVALSSSFYSLCYYILDTSAQFFLKFQHCQDSNAGLMLARQEFNHSTIKFATVNMHISFNCLSINIWTNFAGSPKQNFCTELFCTSKYYRPSQCISFTIQRRLQ